MTDRDELFDEAARFVVQSGQASTSMLQRRFRIGFSRAGRLVDMMERDGIIGPADGVEGARDPGGEGLLRDGGQLAQRDLNPQAPRGARPGRRRGARGGARRRRRQRRARLRPRRARRRARARPDAALYPRRRRPRRGCAASAQAQAQRAEWEAVVLRYRKVVARYPRSGYSDNALLAAGSLYREMAERFQARQYRDDALTAYRRW